MAKQLKERVEVGTEENGKPIYKWATGFTKQELLINAAKLLCECGELTPQEKPASGKHQFKEYAQDWFDVFKKPTVRPLTAQTYAQQLEKHLYLKMGMAQTGMSMKDYLQSNAGVELMGKYGYTSGIDNVLRQYKQLDKYQQQKLAFDRIRKTFGLEDYSAHDFRDTCATEWREAGMSIETISKMLGHANSTVTEKCYVKFREKLLDEARGVMNII